MQPDTHSIVAIAIQTENLLCELNDIPCFFADKIENALHGLEGFGGLGSLHTAAQLSFGHPLGLTRTMRASKVRGTIARAIWLWRETRGA
jgi:hypothetical protein